MEAAGPSVAAQEGGRAAAIGLRGCEPGYAAAGWWYLRKTARGASSPAKPALHIPELAAVSSGPSHQYGARSGMEQLLGVGGGTGAANADSPQQGWPC